jgi:hypothetical protein
VPDAGSAQIDRVVFEAGGHRWAADAWDVVRVDRRRGAVPSVWLAPASGWRALVIGGKEGREVQVPIDRLVGFERVGCELLRPVPPFARGLANPAVVGAWLAQKEIVLLIDLHALVKEQRT